MTQHYAVVGNPIEHSKSPLIHARFAQQFGLDLEYEKRLIALEDFEGFVKDFFAAADNKGLNVTVPFKERAWALAEDLSERARLAGAVNTLFLNAQGQLRGDNTDGIGLVNDLERNHGVSLRGKRILVLGAGGAVRGILQPFLLHEPQELVIANRTLSKVDDLLALFPEESRLRKSAFSELEGCFDLIVNGSSASLSGAIPPIDAAMLDAETVVYDMMYADQLTVFNRWALDHGVKQAIDGLGMLVEQAAEAFYLWTGCRPDTVEVIKSLRKP